MSRIRARLERLEQRIPPTGVINWDNLLRRREDIVPDGIVDWHALHEPLEAWSAEECPIERAITEVGAAREVLVPDLLFLHIDGTGAKAE